MKKHFFDWLIWVFFPSFCFLFIFKQDGTSAFLTRSISRSASTLPAIESLYFSFFFSPLYLLRSSFQYFQTFQKALKGVLPIKRKFFVRVWGFFPPLYVAKEKKKQKNWLKPHLCHFLFLLGFVRLARQSKGQPVIYGNRRREGRGKKACYVQIL